MAIANPALLNASSEQRGVSPVEFICVKANCLEPSARKGVPEERRRLPKIFVSADSQPINPTPLFDFLSRLLSFVKFLQGLRDALEIADTHLAALDARIEKVAFREFPHLHGIFDDWVAFAKNQPRLFH